MPVSEARAARAISQAGIALRRRKSVEEGAHSSVIAALNRALKNEGSELQQKLELMKEELSHCYKSQAHVSEQLVQEMQNSQSLKSQLSDKVALSTELNNELESARARITNLEKELQGKEATACLLVEELSNLKLRVKELEDTLKVVEAENKDLIDRWMALKMEEANKFNEINAMYADMMERCKMNSLAELAKQQVDGIVRQSEEGAESYMTHGAPSSVKLTLRAAHERGCTALTFEHRSETLLTAGHDKHIRYWETGRGTCTGTLQGALGSITDLALTSENNRVLGGCSDNKIYLWDTRTRKLRHELTGHTDKITSVAIAQGSNGRAVTSAYDRSIKIWDLHKGFVVHTTPIIPSNCNALSFSMDGSVICSGHTDGALRFWDCRAWGKVAKELTAHEPHAITSVSLSRSGHMVLTSGKDNVLKLFDMRTLELKSTFRGSGYTVATNFCRSSMSGDENYIAAGSSDGSVYIWNTRSSEAEAVLQGGHQSPVLACSWSEMSKSLATADRQGTVCVWH